MKGNLSIALMMCALLTWGCQKEKPPDYQYHLPESASDGWEVGDAVENGVCSRVIARMMDELSDRPGHGFHDILIVKNGKLVFEEYFDGYLFSQDPPGSNGEFISYNRETDHFLASVTKSVTSVIVGAAVKEGYLGDLQARVVDVLPGYEEILTGEKANITIEHLLTMSSGLAWDESSTSYEDPSNDVTQLFNAEDPIEYILSLPLVDPPGTQFLYNSGGTNVLGAILREATGRSLLEFGNEYLFDPLNVEGGSWMGLPGDHLFASGGLFLRPRELAKIGSLLLNDGYWKGTQVITGEWIAASVSEHVPTQGRTLPLAHAYGYQWWIQDYAVEGRTFSTYMAAGWGDQYMIVFPEHDMIVVMNGGNYLSSGPVSPFSLVKDFFIPALFPFLEP